MKPSRDIPDEFLGVAEELESHRPQLSGLDADRIKLRAMGHGATTTTRTSTKGLFMRSRLAITSLLAFGLLLTGSGAALGVSALSATESASQAQYGQPPKVLGDEAEGDQDDDGVTTLGGGDNGEVAGDIAGGGEVAGDIAGGGEVAGDRAGGAEAPLAAAQAPRQLESGQGGGLPFTGYAAVPTLLIGIGLLAMGLILRRNPGRPTA